ncbi:5883_t:CDS:2 [Funneliformis mosseae]|uniref:5883_t:CDS:1 n=1 Tax=Funneliformis mosseae TaxID=27381 RepID=A0A9N9D981_FUNMO|nr:5883_t:CDS:2 [Funneliformis mosseae]
MVKEFSNKSAEVNFNACFAAAGLVSGINRQSIQMTFMYASVISQLCKASYHNYQAMTFEKIVESAEISTKIALQKVINVNYCKIKGKRTLPMKYAILISIFGKLTPILEEHDMLINVTIDGDLDSNKTLRNVAIVNQIFADLKHEKNIRNVQTEGLFQRLCGNHKLCWPEICWIKNNSELQLSEPTLKFYTPYQREKFKSMLEIIFLYLDKRIDYWKSYLVRHALAILHNNERICEMINVTCLVCNVILSDQDLVNISKIELERN